MHYEHTTKAIISLILGLYLLVMCIIVVVCGPSYMPFSDVTPNVFVKFVCQCIKFGFILGPVLIALGVAGVYREYWVRKFERQIQS